jgi:predicted lipoprotein
MNNSAKISWAALAVGVAMLFSGATLVRKGAVATTAAPSSASAPVAERAGADPAAMARRMWAPKVLPYLETHATDLAPLLAALDSDPAAAGKRYGHRARGEDAAWNFIVRGQGVVLSAQTAALTPTLQIDTNQDGKADIELQCGPIFYGTALRDALDFVSFGTFDNQISYGEFATALNDLAHAGAIREACAGAAPGRALNLLGAFSHDKTAALPALMAVRVEWRGAP